MTETGGKTTFKRCPECGEIVLKPNYPNHAENGCEAGEVTDDGR